MGTYLGLGIDLGVETVLDDRRLPYYRLPGTHYRWSQPWLYL